MPFSVPWYPLTSRRHVSLVSSWLWQFLTLSLFWMTSAMWKTIGQTFCPVSLSSGFLTFLSGVEQKTTEVNCQSHRLLRRLQTMNVTPHRWCWPWSTAEVVFVGILCCQVTLPCPLDTRILGSQWLWTHTWGVLSYAPSSWRQSIYIHYWEFPVEDTHRVFIDLFT